MVRVILNLFFCMLLPALDAAVHCAHRSFHDSCPEGVFMLFLVRVMTIRAFPSAGQLAQPSGMHLKDPAIPHISWPAGRPHPSRDVVFGSGNSRCYPPIVSMIFLAEGWLELAENCLAPLSYTGWFWNSLLSVRTQLDLCRSVRRRCCFRRFRWRQEARIRSKMQSELYACLHLECFVVTHLCVWNSWGPCADACSQDYERACPVGWVDMGKGELQATCVGHTRRACCNDAGRCMRRTLGEMSLFCHVFVWSAEFVCMFC